MVIKIETLHEKLKGYRLYSIRNQIRLENKKLLIESVFRKDRKIERKKLSILLLAPRQ